MIVACKTSESELSLLVVEADSPGFRRGRRLIRSDYVHRILLSCFSMMSRFRARAAWAMKAQLRDVDAQSRPGAARSGGEKHFGRLRPRWSGRSRILPGVTRSAGRSLPSRTTQFKLADLSVQIVAGRTLVDACLAQQVRGRLDPVDAARAKLYCTEVHCRTVDECLQLHGGYGYLSETPIARAYVDARATKIVGGSSEILKTIVARDLLRR